MRRSRSIALPSLVALAAVATLAAAVPAAAQSTSHTAHTAPALPTASGPTESVTLQLTPRDARGLARLATTRGLTQAQRISRLDAVLPGTARAEQVATLARRLGLTVAGYDELSVDVTGRASTVRALFGSARAQQPSLPTAQALPTIPSAFAGLVTVAVGGDETRPAVKSHAVRPSSLRSASTAAAPTDGSISIAQARGISRVATTTAVPSSTAPIIASLQFPSPAVQGQTGVSNLLSDLSKYASTNKIYGSTAWSPGNGTTGQVVAVTPTGGSNSLSYPNTSYPPDCTDGESYDPDETADEVALDQETLLTSAPQLRQRIYYAPNCGDAQYDAMKQVLFDVTTNGLPISALSTSWGQCEPQLASALLTEDQSVVEMLQAAGVTVFAASGDTGADDCTDASGNTIAADAVDDPGSVPGVVAVGGTTGTRAYALGTWNSDGFASGGGFSCVGSDGSAAFAQPSYQSTVSENPSYPHNGYTCPTSSTKRQVPDIAADAAEGLDTVVTEIGQSQTTYQIIGTSFSAPLAAGGYAQTLANAGKTGTDVQNASSTGLPGLLYAATSGLTDVTRGDNGDYYAGPGWDPTTGLGTPQWPALLASVTGYTAPAASPSTLAVNVKLTQGQKLVSPDGDTELVMQTDGNLVLYDLYTGTPEPIFGFSTNGNAGDYAMLQTDGNFVVYTSAGRPLRGLSSNVYGAKSIALLNDGALSGLSAGGVPVFSRTTAFLPTGYGVDQIPYRGVLSSGASLVSPNGAYTATMQSNGNLVVNGTTIGSGGAGSVAYVNPAGRLVIEKNGAQPTYTSASGWTHDALSVSNAGALQLTAADGQVVWTTASSATGRGDTLTLSQRLNPGQALWDTSGTYTAVMQTDGNFVIYEDGAAIFQSGTGKHAGAYAIFQSDGNFVIYLGKTALFSTGTSRKGATKMIMQSDGNLVIYAGTKAIWASR